MYKVGDVVVLTNRDTNTKEIIYDTSEHLFSDAVQHEDINIAEYLLSTGVNPNIPFHNYINDGITIYDTTSIYYNER